MKQTAIFTVTGMKCGGCENNVIEKLTALDGVISAVADAKKITSASNSNLKKSKSTIWKT